MPQENIQELFTEVETKFYEMPQPPLKAEPLIPLGSPIPSGAQTYRYYKQTGIGMAAMIDDHSQNIPTVSIALTPVDEQIENVLTSYDFSVSDLEAANYAQQNLDMSQVGEARRAIAVATDKFLLTGERSQGGVATNKGLINNPNVTLATSGKHVSAMTYDEIKALIVAMTLEGANKVNKDAIKVDTIVLPRSVYGILLEKNVSTLADTSWLQGLKTRFPEITMWDYLDELETAGTGGTKRAIAYTRNSLYIRRRNQIPFETRPVQETNFIYHTPCRARIGGCDVIRPTTMVYMDNL